MEKVYITDKIPEAGLNLLKEHFEVNMHEGEGIIGKETLKKGVRDASALVSTLSTNVDKEVIDSGESLKIIANCGAGFNNVDVGYAREKNIDVTNTPEASTAVIAELTFDLVLTIARHIVEGDKLSRIKGFDGWAPLFFRSREVSGRTLGIIGFGEIGSAVAKRAKGFDMDILYTGPHQKKEKEREIGVRYVDLDTLLEHSDFITISAAYNPDIRHMVDSEQFKKMKSTAYLINAGCGPIVNEQAFVDTLKRKGIEGAALDVYEFEPDITEGLKSLDNAVITPHIGSATFEAREMMSKIVASDTIRKLNGEEPQLVVSKK